MVHMFIPSFPSVKHKWDTHVQRVESSRAGGRDRDSKDRERDRERREAENSRDSAGDRGDDRDRDGRDAHTPRLSTSTSGDSLTPAPPSLSHTLPHTCTQTQPPAPQGRTTSNSSGTRDLSFVVLASLSRSDPPNPEVTALLSNSQGVDLSGGVGYGYGGNGGCGYRAGAVAIGQGQEQGQGSDQGAMERAREFAAAAGRASGLGEYGNGKGRGDVE
jgi:hypothetical protein